MTLSPAVSTERPLTASARCGHCGRDSQWPGVRKTPLSLRPLLWGQKAHACAWGKPPLCALPPKHAASAGPLRPKQVQCTPRGAPCDRFTVAQSVSDGTDSGSSGPGVPGHSAGRATPAGDRTPASRRTLWPSSCWGCDSLFAATPGVCDHRRRGTWRGPCARPALRATAVTSRRFLPPPRTFR